MKKLLFVFAIAGVAALSSCKKEYTCTCTADGVSSSVTFDKMKKSDAEDKCDEGDMEVAGTKVECEID